MREVLVKSLLRFPSTREYHGLGVIKSLWTTGVAPITLTAWLQVASPLPPRLHSDLHTCAAGTPIAYSVS